MKLISPKSVSLALCFLCFLTLSKAATFTDNFDSSHDYLNQGVAGTLWLGVTAGTTDPGTVTAWDANITTPDTLTITNSGGAWADGGDGPYLWKTVSGDFTNIVHVSNMPQINYNFAGLLVRDPNSLTNWLYLSLFAEFGFELDLRDTVDGTSTETTYVGGNYVETNSATWRSWLQITRVSGVLTAYASLDGVNWDFLYQSTRADLTNDLQVGVFDSTFSANVCSAQFQNFSISGPNIATNTPPAQATGLTVTPAIGSLQVAWTPGTNSVGSVVLVRRALPITRQPVHGTSYNGNAVFGSGDDLGEANFVAYVGSGSSVVITNLTPTISYTVAVYAFSGSGTATIYALTNAPVTSAAPAGLPVNITISYVSTNAVAVDDTIQSLVTLYFSDGSSVDVTADSTFSSANGNVATISSAGIASGLSVGTAAITANYQAFTTSSNLVVVKLPVTDDFSTPRNYLTQGIAGTYWNGLMLDTNDLDLDLGETALGATETLTADASITQTNRLTVDTTLGGFNIGADSGFFLYRVINGDFSISIQIPNFQSDNNTNSYHMPGLMVRAPFDFAYSENFFQLVGFNEYGIGNFERQVISGAYTENYDQPLFAQPYIMIQRQTNTFNFYQKAHALDPWTLIGSSGDMPQFAGVPMQVGIVDQTFTGNTAESEFANLLITTSDGLTNSVNAPSPVTGLALTNIASSEVAASWVAGIGSSGSVVIAHPLLGVTRQPSDGDDYSGTAAADFTVGDNLGASNVVVYAGAGTSLVISNLPSSTCYFSVYSYTTVNGTNYYNLMNPVSTVLNLGGGTAVITPVVINPQSFHLTGTGTSAFASFSFTNAPGLSFSVCATNTLTAPIATWPVIGTAVENPSGSGQYQFTDLNPATNSTLFYMLRQP